MDALIIELDRIKKVYQKKIGRAFIMDVQTNQ